MSTGRWRSAGEKTLNGCFFHMVVSRDIFFFVADPQICTMSTISITKLYDLLSAKVGKETAENLTTFIENKIDHELESKTQILATKEDLAKLTLANKEHLTKFALENKEDHARLDAKISETKSEIMRWMFIFWIGQVVVTFGFILLFIKK